MIDVSIIIPIYNTANEQLERCFNSVAEIQNIQFECILVDDGSEPEVGRFCKAYVEKDSRFVYLWKENGGVSSARNLGISYAQGRFISFVDSDDAVISAAYGTPGLFDDAFDLVFTDLIIKVGRKEKLIKAFDKPGAIIYETAVNRICTCEKISGPYCKFFKRSFLEKVSVWFDENLIQGEDAVFFLTLLKEKPKMLYWNYASYYYYYSYVHSNERFRNQPIKCIENEVSVFGGQIDCIMSSSLMDGEREKLLRTVKSNVISVVFRRVLNSVEYDVFSKSFQDFVKIEMRQIARIECGAYCRVAKLKEKLLNMRCWVWLYVIFAVRAVYLFLKLRVMKAI